MAKKKKRGTLHIGLKGSVFSLLKDYCKETDFDVLDIGYNLGTLTGDSSEKKMVLRMLMEIAFFTGVYCIKEHPDKVLYKYTTKKDWEKFREQFSGLNEDEEKNIETSNKSYFG